MVRAISTCISIASLYGIQLSDVRVIPAADFVYDPKAPVATLCSDPLEVGSLIAVCNLPMFSRMPAVDTYPELCPLSLCQMPTALLASK